MKDFKIHNKDIAIVSVQNVEEVAIEFERKVPKNLGDRAQMQVYEYAIFNQERTKCILVRDFDVRIVYDAKNVALIKEGVDCHFKLRGVFCGAEFSHVSASSRWWTSLSELKVVNKKMIDFQLDGYMGNFSATEAFIKEKEQMKKDRLEIQKLFEIGR